MHRLEAAVGCVRVEHLRARRDVRIVGREVDGLALRSERDKDVVADPSVHAAPPGRVEEQLELVGETEGNSTPEARIAVGLPNGASRLVRVTVRRLKFASTKYSESPSNDRSMPPGVWVPLRLATSAGGPNDAVSAGRVDSKMWEPPRRSEMNIRDKPSALRLGSMSFAAELYANGVRSSNAPAGLVRVATTRSKLVPGRVNQSSSGDSLVLASKPCAMPATSIGSTNRDPEHPGASTLASAVCSVGGSRPKTWLQPTSSTSKPRLTVPS